jgi:hypothetical protein
MNFGETRSSILNFKRNDQHFTHLPFCTRKNEGPTASWMLVRKPNGASPSQPEEGKLVCLREKEVGILSVWGGEYTCGE